MKNGGFLSQGKQEIQYFQALVWAASKKATRHSLKVTRSGGKSGRIRCFLSAFVGTCHYSIHYQLTAVLRPLHKAGRKHVGLRGFIVGHWDSIDLPNWESPAGTLKPSLHSVPNPIQPLSHDLFAKNIFPEYLPV